MKTLDILGAIVGISALTLIDFAWNQALVVSWSQPYVYVTLILGILLVPVFFFVEMKVSSLPLVPLDAVNGSVDFVLACVSCGWASFGIWLYYSWQFFQQIRGSNPLLTSAFYVPSAISGALAAITTGIIIQHLHPAWIMTMSLAAFTVATVLIATAPVDQTYWAETFISTGIISWGIDMTFPAGTIILSNAVKKEHQGVAASLVNTCVE